MKALASGIIPQNCGVGWLGIFRESGDQAYGIHLTKDNLTPIGGCGWVLAGFTTKRPEYKKAYEKLKARYPIVYQSPVRKNTRTSREFFFCIFDTKGKV